MQQRGRFVGEHLLGLVDPGARERLQQARAVSAGSPLVAADQAAKLLGVPPRWLLEQARQQKVPHHKLGRYVRFDLDDLIKWLDETKRNPRRGG